MAALALVVAVAKPPLPWAYRGYDAFPACFFGASPFGLENKTELELVVRHQVAGWGWQQGCFDQCGAHCDHKGGCPQTPPNDPSIHEDEELPLWQQAQALQAFNGSKNVDGVFVYRQMTQAIWWYSKNYDAITNPQMRNYFLRSARDDSFCWDFGPVWDFRNTSAADYFVDQVIGELVNESRAVNLVFFDGGEGIVAANPHPSPSGNIGTTNCTAAHGDLNLTDTERLVFTDAYIEVMRRSAERLNAHGMFPVYSLEAPFDPSVAQRRGFPVVNFSGPGLLPLPVNSQHTQGQRQRQQRGQEEQQEEQQFVMTEERIVHALENVTWLRYYEWFQASGWSASIGMSVANMVEEVRRGIPVVAHAYPERASAADPDGIGAAIAAFLLAQGPYTYFSTSPSSADPGADPWTDAGWRWHSLFDLRCGVPLGPASRDDTSGVWRRDFAKCTVELDQRSGAFNITQHAEQE